MLCPVFGGPSAGALSIANSAVMLQQKVLSTLRNVDSGAMRLEPDQYIDGKWTTMPDELTPRRLELLTDSTHDFLSVSHQFAAAEFVPVYLVTGEVVEEPHSEVTVTDWLRLFVREQALTGGAVEFAQAALSAVTLKPAEAWTAAATRHLLAFRASLANSERPHVTEQLFFWHFITPLEMTTLYDRVVQVLLPNPLDRVDVNGLMHEKVHMIATTLRPMRMEGHDPMGEAMRLRGEVAERLFREFIAVLSARNASYLTLQAPRKVAKHAGPERLFTMTEVRPMFSSPAGALAALNVAASVNPGVDTLAPVPLPLLAKPLAALAPTLWPASQPSTGHPTDAAFQNQTATAPVQNGVPFEKSRTAAPTQRADATPTAHAAAGTRPPTTAARRDILDYLRTKRVCFAHAFSGNYRRPCNCRWQHEPLPAAFYKEVASSRRPGNSNPRCRLAAMTETQYNMAAELGLAVEDAADETKSAGADDGGQARASIDQYEQVEGTS